MAETVIERLQSIIKKLKRAQFGRRSERLDADQLARALEDLDGDVARIRESRPATATDALEARSRRKPLPDHLPLLAQVMVSKYCDHTPLYRQFIPARAENTGSGGYKAAP